jgi:hypothetical protein
MLYFDGRNARQPAWKGCLRAFLTPDTLAATARRQKAVMSEE